MAVKSSKKLENLIDLPWIERFKRYRIDQPHKIDIDFFFSQEQFAILKQGFLPKGMEDKWGIYYSKGALYFHRSWSNIRIYKAKITRHGGGYEIKSFDVERNPQKYRNTDDGEDIAILSFLIADLLGIDASNIFLPSEDGESNALKLWSIFGRKAIREEDYPD